MKLFRVEPYYLHLSLPVSTQQGLASSVYRLKNGASVVLTLPSSMPGQLTGAIEFMYGIKVKEPQSDQILFTYLQLAPDPLQTELLVASSGTCITYETVTNNQSAWSLLASMNEVVGILSVQAGAYHSRRHGRSRYLAERPEHLSGPGNLSCRKRSAGLPLHSSRKSSGRLNFVSPEKLCAIIVTAIMIACRLKTVRDLCMKHLFALIAQSQIATCFTSIHARPEGGKAGPPLLIFKALLLPCGCGFTPPPPPPPRL